MENQKLTEKLKRELIDYYNSPDWTPQGHLLRVQFYLTAIEDDLFKEIGQESYREKYINFMRSSNGCK